MRNIAIKNDELDLPGFGYGTYPQKETLSETIPVAVSAGYRLVDSSDNYFNEEFVGRGLAECGDVRDHVLVATKFSWPQWSYKMFRCFERSRKRLGGRIDLYLLHWPYPFLWKMQWRRMERLVSSGRCRWIGVCNFELPQLERLLRFCKVKPVVNQFERHPLFQQNDIASFCRANGIRVMCYSPLARMDKRLVESRVIMRLAGKYGKSAAQIVLRWHVEHGDMPIPASSSKERIVSNFDVWDFALTKDEMAEIDSLQAGCRIRFDPKTRFSFSAKVKFFFYRLRMMLPARGERI